MQKKKITSYRATIGACRWNISTREIKRKGKLLHIMADGSW